MLLRLRVNVRELILAKELANVAVLVTNALAKMSAKAKAGKKCRLLIAKKPKEPSKLPMVNFSSEKMWVGSRPMLGVGLRPQHFPYLESSPQVQSDFFEAISENFMNSQGRPFEMLKKVRADRPIALHGVSMSIGSAKGPSDNYLNKLKNLVQEIEPLIVSDHLCWARSESGNSHDLLPVPLNKESLDLVCSQIDRVQSHLGRKILLENISYYFQWKTSDIAETEFLKQMCARTGCSLLLDLNNIYVNSVNHGFQAWKYVDQIPIELIGQIHLAGPSQQEGFLFDTHSSTVPEEVWSLLQQISLRGLKSPILLEWDEHIPDFGGMENEMLKAKEYLYQVGRAEEVSV